MSNKLGQLIECIVSKKYHQKYVPILCQPRILRCYGGGQVDVGYVEHKTIHIIECKNKMIITPKQVQRLYRSGLFLSHILGLELMVSVYSHNQKKIYSLLE